jgi:hypothetical protein
MFSQIEKLKIISTMKSGMGGLFEKKVQMEKEKEKEDKVMLKHNNFFY